MYFIPLAILIISSAGVFYILIRKIRTLPNVAQDSVLVYPDFDGKSSKQEPDSSEESSYLAKIFSIEEDGPFLIFIEKFFKRARVKLMKVENWLASISENLQRRRLQKKSSKDEEADKGDATFIKIINGGNEKFDEQYWLNVLKEDSKSVYPYKKLADIYIAREDFREARYLLKHALRLDPTDAEMAVSIDGLRGKRTKGK